VQAADVIHLHWVNQGFLSLKNIYQLSALGKPIVWTLHDMWAFTGGCHYSSDCVRFKEVCGFCPYLRNPGPEGLSDGDRSLFVVAKNLAAKKNVVPP
jgi:hypothetical protein